MKKYLIIIACLAIISATQVEAPAEAKPTFEPRQLSTVDEHRWIGQISFYSHDGCLGCSNPQITASGEPFDENAMTLAIPAEKRKEMPMGTWVRVTNLDNGKSVEAKVNDTGGFSKYGRIADLSKGLYEALDAKTDQSTIEIVIIKKTAP